MKRILLSLAAFAVTSAAHADALSDAAFSLRFPAAFAHFSPFADVAAKGGAAAASPFGSSPSLTGIAWSFDQEQDDFQGSLNYYNLSFDAGTMLHIGTQTLAMDAGDVGVFRLSLIEFGSNTDTTRQAPVQYEFDLLGTRLDWSKRFGEFGAGAGIGFTQSDTLFSTPRLTLSDSEKDNWTFRLGGQRALGDRWLIAASADYGYGDTTSALATVLPQGVRRAVVDDTMHQWVIQPGIAYIIGPRAVAHLDYQYGWFSNGTGELTTHRWSLGSDFPLTDWCMLRAGATIDRYGNPGWTGGLGFFPRRGTTINVAYQNGIYPELDREFGNSQVINVSFSIKW